MSEPDLDAVIALPVDLSRMVVCPQAIACLSEANARRLMIVPVALIEEHGNTHLLIAVQNTSDGEQQGRVRRHLNRSLQLKLTVATRVHLLTAIDKCYRHNHDLNQLLTMCSVEPRSQKATDAAEEFHIHLIEALLREACRRRASDIHLSPVAGGLLIRIRVDGVLEVVAILQERVISALTARIKVLAALDIAESRLPQDGQFNQFVDGQQVDFRVSVFPTVTGENIVLRVIRNQRGMSLRALSLPADTIHNLRNVLSRPDGMIIVCGPTGSGKSTTLFALLAEMDQQALNIMTLEDPVEHRESGIRQSSIDPERSFDFSQGVKAMLRQDPDVLLIGEIRDPASCEMALRAATSGHQVLTTIHAASAHTALTRLRELHARPHIVAACLSAIIAQRLVRKNCAHCELPDRSSCSYCRGTGYFGRQAILEVLCIDDVIREMIAKEVKNKDIEASSRVAGFVDMREQARRLVSAGVVARCELERVLGPVQVRSGKFTTPEADGS